MAHKKKKKEKISKKSKMNLEQLSNEKCEEEVVKEVSSLRNDEPKVTMCIRITVTRKQKLKLYAAKHDTTVSGLISSYVDRLPTGGH